MIEVDLGPGQQKVQDAFEQFAKYGIKNAAQDEAIAAAQTVADKTKAEVDAVIQMVEDTLQGVLLDGADALYESLGLNEEVLNFAKNIVQMAMHATDLAGSAVLKGMALANSFDAHSIPMSAAAAALAVTKSIVDTWINGMVEKYGVYAEMVIQFIVDPGEALEMLKGLIDIALKQIEELIDEQCIKYLGMSLTEIKFYCIQGLNMYKQYKAARKARKEQEQKDDEAQAQGSDEGINKSGSSVSADFEVSVDPNILKASLYAWMESLSDGLYNGFLLLQVIDMVKSIKEVIKAMTDISLESLTENMDTMEDLINLLDELGLGDDSMAIDLSMIPALNLNDVYASFNRLKEQMTDVGTYTSLVGAAANSVTVTGSVNQNKTYDISTDKESMTITIAYYQDPTKSSISKKVYKTITNAKDSQDKPLFSASDAKNIMDTVNKLWESGEKEGSLKAGKYTIKIVINITKDEVNKQKDQEATKKQDDDMYQQPDGNIELEVIQERQKKNPDEKTRRNTIQLLHTIFSILKPLLPQLKTLMTLIRNYKTNKAYVRSHQDENLFAVFKDALAKLGFNKEEKMDGSDSPNGQPNTLYTIRTNGLYQHLMHEYPDMDFDGITTRGIIEQVVKEEMNRWLRENDPDSLQIDTKANVKLFIDFDSIEYEQKCIQEKRRLLGNLWNDELMAQAVAECKKINGTFDGIDKIEMVGNSLVYSNSRLPRLPSQILMAQMHQFEP